MEDKFKNITGIEFKDFYNNTHKSLLYFLNWFKPDYENIDDIFMKLLNNIEKYNKEKSSLKTYLFLIGKHYMIQFHNKKNNKKNINTVYIENYDEFLNDILCDDILCDDEEYNNLLDNFYERLEELPQKRIDLINLKIEGYSLKQISEMTGFNINKVKHLIYYTNSKYIKKNT